MTTFHVQGIPVQQGSVRAFGSRVVHDNKAELKSWRYAVAVSAQAAGIRPADAALKVNLTFTFIRHKSVTAKKRPHPNVKPDLDKLVRAVLDALTGVAWRDDAQVVAIEAVKVYGDAAGLTCELSPVPPLSLEEEG